MLERTAIAGTVVWLAWGLALAATDWLGARVFPTIEWLTVLGPLVIVPIGLPLADLPRTPAAMPPSIRWGVPLGAIGAAASMALEKGPAAAMLGGAWLAATVLIARRATGRLRARSPRGLAERCIDFARLYLFVGGLMWVVARSGYAPFGLQEPTVTLAATHFCFAGFALLTVTGEVGRLLGAMHGVVSGPTRTAWVMGAWLALLCPPLVAVGIIAWPLLEVLAAVALAVGAAAVGLVMTGAVATRVKPLGAAALLAGAGLALVAAMGIAALYGVGIYRGTAWLDAALMIPLHGVPNAVVFGLGGLLGLRWARRADRAVPSGTEPRK